MGPVTDLPMRWGFWLPVWAFAALFSVSVSLWLIPPVAASGGNDAGCIVVGTVGTVIVAKCTDDYGNEVWANSAGFMAMEP